MNSFLTPQFFENYHKLPEAVRQKAREAYRLFAANPQHPSLRFRCVHPVRPVFSARVDSDYRTVGIRDGEDIHWFWIGPHREYDRPLKQL